MTWFSLVISPEVLEAEAQYGLHNQQLQRQGLQIKLTKTLAFMNIIEYGTFVCISKSSGGFKKSRKTTPCPANMIYKNISLFE